MAAAGCSSVITGVAAARLCSPRGDVRPLVVDLDGALLKVNVLHERLFALLVHRRWRLTINRASFTPIVRASAHIESVVSSSEVLDVETLPLSEGLVTWLREQAAAGRELHLVSSADQAIVDRLAGRLQLFESCVGNVRGGGSRGAAKADCLRRRFPEGFSYAGGSATELEVWRTASTAIVAGAQPAVRRRIERLGKPIEAEFPAARVGFAVWVKQLRLHQWSKNLLVFLPLLLAHRFTDLQGWRQALLAFAGMSLVASATYMVNDLSDLSDDRRHITKRNRPLAAGTLPVWAALAVAPVMLIAGLGCAYAAGSEAVLILVIYATATLAYSFRLKRIPLLDTAIIGSLFTLRIVLGTVAVNTPSSPWLLAFSVMLFFSLAMAKRHSEITKATRSTTAEKIAGRGYEPGDVLLTLVYGIGSGIASLVISMLYITDGVATVLYSSPDWLWSVPLLLYLWQMRLWLLAHRGMLDDDPIVFALTDRTSLLLGTGCLLALFLAL